MKIAEINTVDYGSTGNIMLQIADCAEKNGHDVRTFSKKWKNQKEKRKFHSYYGFTVENAINVVLSKIIGFQGMFSYFGTKQLVRKLERFNPDVIHLHNLHDYCICLPVLFKYIAKKQKPVVWTLHDCWAMTGECPYFTMVKCDKWKTGCSECTQLSACVPIDCSKFMWNKKKNLFTGIDKMIIVTPSKWLADLVKLSYLNKYNIRVINNGIDLSIFKPRANKLREKLKLNKYVVLGVALGWGVRKGLDAMQELSRRLPEQYSIIMVGTDDNVDKVLSDRIISIHRTHNQKELAEIYSIADVFINPTREDNFPTTNIESLACGTPVITYKTGGSSEMLDASCGIAVECDNIDKLEKCIIDVCENKPYSSQSCLKRAGVFDKNDKFKEYVKLFEDVYEMS